MSLRARPNRRAPRVAFVESAFAESEFDAGGFGFGALDVAASGLNVALVAIEDVELHAGFSEADESGGAMRDGIEKFAVLREAGAQF